jgi:hypothetical protein
MSQQMIYSGFSNYPAKIELEQKKFDVRGDSLEA